MLFVRVCWVLMVFCAHRGERKKEIKNRERRDGAEMGLKKNGLREGVFFRSDQF